jgi:hypothetical protein
MLGNNTFCFNIFLSPQPLGLYRFEKWRRICEVRVFAMQVTEFSENWPESGMRCRIWTNPERAEEVVKHKELGELIGISPPG